MARRPKFINGKDPTNPATTSLAWDTMAPNWGMTDDLLGGTRTMRSAAHIHLPQHAAESDDNYSERLHVNVLFNALELTLEHFVGRPFSDPVRLNNDVPDEIVEDAKNIDLQGNDLTSFSREWFREGLAKGFAHVMIDMPQMDEAEREGRTLEDDRNEGRRPFWLLIRPENMIFAEAELVVDPQSGEMREWYSHVRLRENTVKRVGFAEVEVERIRILEPGTFEVWEKVQPEDRRKSAEWVIVDAGETGIPIIPIVTFYSSREGFLLSKPPLQDLAFLNVRHWQSMSDQINILTVVRFPMLAVAGATSSSGSAMKIGPRQLLATKDANGKFYYVEHQGASIESGWQELKNLEEDMEAYGSNLIRKESLDETAEGRKIDNEESTSALEDMTLRFIDAENTALQIHAFWLGLDDGGTVTITSEFGPEQVSDTIVDLLKTLRKDRDISRLTVIKQAQKLGVLPEDYDPDKDFVQLVKEDVALKPLQPQVPGTFDPTEEGKDRKTPSGAGTEAPSPRSEELEEEIEEEEKEKKEKKTNG